MQVTCKLSFSKSLSHNWKSFISSTTAGTNISRSYTFKYFSYKIGLHISPLLYLPFLFLTKENDTFTPLKKLAKFPIWYLFLQ